MAGSLRSFRQDVDAALKFARREGKSTVTVEVPASLIAELIRSHLPKQGWKGRPNVSPASVTLTVDM